MNRTLASRFVLHDRRNGHTGVVDSFFDLLALFDDSIKFDHHCPGSSGMFASSTLFRRDNSLTPCMIDDS